MNMRNRLLFFLLLVIIGLPVLGMLSNSSRSGAAGMIGSGSNAAPTTMMARDQSELAGVMELPDERVIDAKGIPLPGDKVVTSIAPVPPLPANQGFAEGKDRTIVKNAQLGLIVDDLRKTVASITQNTETLKGVVVNSNIYENASYQGGSQADMVVRVPVAQLETALIQFRALATKVTQDSVSADDQTKQKVDLEARLKNLKASEEQLLTIMKQAKNVTETLEVQRQLTDVRGQIESMTASLENLQGDAAMSTISIHLSTKPSDAPITGPSQLSLAEELKTALRDAARAYRNLFVAGIRLAILILPVLVIFGVIWFVWQRRARKS